MSDIILTDEQAYDTYHNALIELQKKYDALELEYRQFRRSRRESDENKAADLAAVRAERDVLRMALEQLQVWAGSSRDEKTEEIVDDDRRGFVVARQYVLGVVDAALAAKE